MAAANAPMEHHCNVQTEPYANTAINQCSNQAMHPWSITVTYKQKRMPIQQSTHAVTKQCTHVEMQSCGSKWSYVF